MQHGSIHIVAQDREADQRLSSLAESIAFYGGEVREQQDANARLFTLVNYAKRKIAWMGGLSLWTNFYSYVTMLIPPLMTAPRYFAGEVEFGVITQVSQFQITSVCRLGNCKDI